MFLKIPRSRDGVLTQNSVFFKKFRVFKNSPFEKVCTFEKSRFFQQNILRGHKHKGFSYPLLYIYHSLPHLTSKTFKKQAFKRTISMFDINYRDQKLLRITNLIPVGRLRTKFRTF